MAGLTIEFPAGAVLATHIDPLKVRTCPFVAVVGLSIKLPTTPPPAAVLATHVDPLKLRTCPDVAVVGLRRKGLVLVIEVLSLKVIPEDVIVVPD